MVTTRVVHGALGSLIIVLLLASDANAGIGVNYGTLGNDLPTPEATVALLKTTIIDKVKIFDSNPVILQAFAGSGINIVIGAGNDQIPLLANQPGYALQWATANIAAYPTTDITAVSLGNEVLAYAADVAPLLLPALENLHAALVTLGLDAKVKLSTASSLGIMDDSEPPSNSTFKSWEASILAPVFGFLARTGAPFMINAYPYFAYVGNPANTSLNFVLFQPADVSETRFDPISGLTYSNMFDAQCDAVFWAMEKLGFKNVSIAVTETGWPSAGDQYEFGPSMRDAQIFNKNLIRHISTGVGTPLRPGAIIDTYIFALYNENLKPGQGSEKNFGLFYPTGVPVYDVGILGGPIVPPTPLASPPPPGLPVITPPPPGIPGLVPPPPAFPGLIPPPPMLPGLAPPPPIFPGLAPPPPAAVAPGVPPFYVPPPPPAAVTPGLPPIIIFPPTTPGPISSPFTPTPPFFVSPPPPVFYPPYGYNFPPANGADKPSLMSRIVVSVFLLAQAIIFLLL